MFGVRTICVCFTNYFQLGFLFFLLFYCCCLLFCSSSSCLALVLYRCSSAVCENTSTPVLLSHGDLVGSLGFSHSCWLGSRYPRLLFMFLCFYFRYAPFSFFNILLFLLPFSWRRLSSMEIETRKPGLQQDHCIAIRRHFLLGMRFRFDFGGNLNTKTCINTSNNRPNVFNK